ALVPTKRGAHLALSVERLVHRCEQEPQRIGLSATQRPLDEVARFLGGVAAPEPARRKTAGHALPPSGTSRKRTSAPRPVAETSDAIGDEFSAANGAVRYRPVNIVDAGSTRPLALSIEVPVEDMAR